MDRAIFLWVNHWPEWLAPIFIFLSVAINLWWFRAVLLVYLAWMIKRGKETGFAVLFAILAVIFANTSTNLWKAYWPMHRPFQPEELGSQVHLRLGYANSMGTASAHSANMAAVAMTITLIAGADGWPWIGIAFLVGLSRVYCGVHYPWQVLLGWTTGATWGIVFGFIGRRYLKSRDRSGTNVGKAGVHLENETLGNRNS